MKQAKITETESLGGRVYNGSQAVCLAVKHYSVLCVITACLLSTNNLSTDVHRNELEGQPT